MNTSKISSNGIARNTFLNIVTQGAYIILAFWSLPIIVKHLGAEQFGLLAIVWAVIGYFSLMDFGISRANTKLISELRSMGDRAFEHEVIWSSIVLSVGIGILSGILIFLFSGIVIEKFASLPSSQVGTAQIVFRWTSIGVPFIVIYGTLKGFQIAVNRFDQVNLYQLVTALFQWVGSVLAVKNGGGVVGIIVVTISSRIICTVVVMVSMHWIFSDFYSYVQWGSRRAYVRLLSFGGWVFISQVISPLYLYVDRFILGLLLSLSAVAYYTVPQEALSRLLILTLSLTVVLFPKMSAYSVDGRSAKNVQQLYTFSLKTIGIIGIPLLFLFLSFAASLISVWLGPELEGKTLMIFKILAVGVFFNSLAQIPNTLLQAFGRPDVPAKFHVIEFPMILVMNIILIPMIGVAGAAVSWTIRVTIDSVLHFVAVHRLFPSISFGERSKYFLILMGIIFAGAFFYSFYIYDLTMNGASILMFLVITVVYGAMVWKYILEELERKELSGYIGSLWRV